MEWEQTETPPPRFPTCLTGSISFIIEFCPTLLGIAGKDAFYVLMIRLSRRGARKQPYYRIVVIEKERARDGRSVEVVGTYNPRTNPATVELKHDRVEYWKAKGAQMSATVSRLVAKTPAPTTESAA